MTIQFGKCKVYCRNMLLSLRRLLKALALVGSKNPRSSQTGSLILISQSGRLGISSDVGLAGESDPVIKVKIASLGNFLEHWHPSVQGGR